MNNDIPFSLKSTLVDDKGVAYREFRKTLTPRWALLWLHVAGGYAALIALLVVVATFCALTPVGILVALVGGMAMGYAIEYLSNYFHEAAHYNVAPGRERNDRLTNIFFAWIYWKDISTYRLVHFQHHRALGTPMDSENSYFDALRVRYLAAGILGLKALRSMRRWEQMEKLLTASQPDKRQSKASKLYWSAVGATTDLGVAAILFFAFGSPVGAASWLWGALFVFPFFGSLRQLLEHRSTEADPDVDYNKTDHGVVNRMFGDGPISSTLGSAGFNRHALHHWEPSVSYTRLADLEDYLHRTELKPALEERQTTYLSTFRRLLVR